MAKCDLIPPMLLAKTAYFFDIDGTLAEIKTRPEQVTIPTDIIQVLCELLNETDGALALVSGRLITELDSLSRPLQIPAAGVHGAERRDANGIFHRKMFPQSLFASMIKELNEAIIDLNGCHVEDKGIAFALHYRQSEKYKEQVLLLAQHFVERYPQLELQHGKSVVEFKPAGVNKGAAIMAFMHEAPFNGRTPLFIGDDLTDETGFRQINALHGISIKVGPESTNARYSLKNVSQVHQWLRTLKKQ